MMKAKKMHQVQATLSCVAILATYSLPLSSSWLQYSTVLWSLSWLVIKRVVPLVTTLHTRTMQKVNRYATTLRILTAFLSHFWMFSELESVSGGNDLNTSQPFVSI